MHFDTEDSGEQIYIYIDKRKTIEREKIESSAKGLLSSLARVECIAYTYSLAWPVSQPKSTNTPCLFPFPSLAHTLPNVLCTVH